MLDDFQRSGRFGWVMDHVGAEMPADTRERLLRLASGGARTWMGPNPAIKVRRAIGHDRTWHLFVNVAREDLRESACLGRRKVVKKDA